MSKTLRASSIMFELYEELIQQFRTDQQYAGFTRSNNPELSDHVGVAGNIYHWFPAHYYKALHQIQRYESTYQGATTSLLNMEEITVVDIGAGPGTFTLALCDFLYENSSGTQSPGYKINAVLIEPNDLYYSIAEMLFLGFAERTDLEIDFVTVEDRFPEQSCLQKTKQSIVTSTDFMVFGMCNILKWTSNGIWGPFNSLAERLLKRSSKECKFVEEVYNHAQPTHGILISAETSKHLKLLENIKQLYTGATNNQDLYDINQPSKILYSYINFPGSYFGANNPGKYDNSYFGGCLVFNSAISKMTQIESLKQAFFRARMAMRKEFPCDEVSIKLMEKSLDDNLPYISARIAEGYSFNPRMIGFREPKDHLKSRPKVMLEIADSIAECSFLDLIGQQIDRMFSTNSYGNRINKSNRNNEFIYEYFLYAWLRKYFQRSAKDARKKGFFCYASLDVKSFYSNINQDILMDKLLTNLPQKDKRISLFVRSLIAKKVPYLKSSKRGIPQGPIASGFLANVYLDDFDKYLEEKINQNGCFLYSRYVDNFLLFGKKKRDLLSLEQDISNYINEKLDLELNTEEGKRDFGEIEDLEKELAGDKLLEHFDDTLTKIIKSIYRVDKKHYQQFVEHNQDFLALYRSCLKGLNLNINERWLQRKIHHEQGKLGKIMQFLRLSKQYYPISFPEPPETEEDVSTWIMEFQRNNPKLVKMIKQLQSAIANEMQDICNQYERLDKIDDPALRKKVRRKVRFFTFRAGIVYAPEIVPALKKFLDQPWYYNMYALANYPELSGELMNLLQNGNPDYLKYTAVWALSELKEQSAAESLQEILFHPDTIVLEKILTAQALLKMNAQVDADKLKREIDEQTNYSDKTEPVLLRNLLLLATPDILISALLMKVKRVTQTFNPLDKKLTSTALKMAQQSKINIFDEPDMLPDNMKPSDYPDIEPVPGIVRDS